MKPLCLENSKVLMYERIFGQEDKHKCPDEQLAEVSNKILSKCGGVPLAIITIASLLASKGRNKLKWYDVCNSIGMGLNENNYLDNMRNVLSLSYYDMPTHLRSCLLYLSMFPEDHEIEKDRLTWLWIAEGFIQSRKQEKSLFETGESYLDELINRNMVQPMYSIYTHKVYCCRVHDMVLDLIRSLSSEENFVTVWNGVDHLSSLPVRRLSLQNGKTYHGKPKATMIVEHVRSIVAFPPAIDYVPTLQSFGVLRVLDLNGCDLSKSYNVKYLGNLLHLRYLRLRNTGIDQLPEEIENLQFLLTLDVWGNRISNLSSTIVRLTNLLCLSIVNSVAVPKAFGSLTTLEDLSELGIHNESTDIILELGHLTKLKSLSISVSSVDEWNKGLNTSLVESLNKLHKVQNLCLSDLSYKCTRLRVCLDGWVAPRHLHRLELRNCWFSTLPAWVNPSHLLDLSILGIRVRVLQPEDLKILGRLPALSYLHLGVVPEDPEMHKNFMFAACSFPCLLTCKLTGFRAPVVFEQRAMPRLIELRLEIHMKDTREINGGFDLGLGNLLSLEEMVIWFRSRGASKKDVEEAKAMVRHAIEAHPNHPILHM